MTNDRAAEIMKAIIFMLENEYYSDEVEEAIHMAINALTLRTALKEKCLTCEHCERCDSELANDSPKVGKDSGELISRDAALEACYNGWNKDYREIAQDIKDLPSAQPETHEKRTETHACDLISRKMVLALPRNKVRSLRTYEVVEETINVTDIEHLPSAQPEIIRCNACRHWTQTTGKMHGFGLGNCDYHNAKLVNCNGFCYWAERRTDG